MSNSELAVSYAALILADDGLEVTVSLRAVFACRPLTDYYSFSPTS